MDLGNLLGALNQGFETSVLTQVDAKITSPTATNSGNSNQASSTQLTPGTPTPASTGVTIATPTGTVTLQPATTSSGPSFSPQLPGGASLPAGTLAQSAGSSFAQPGAVSTFQPTLFGQPESRGFTSTLGGGPTADVYYGAEAPASASLLARSGVGAYVQLVNVLASNEVNTRSASALTQTLATAAAALKLAFQNVVAKLPADLQQKDWGFSLSNNGTLEFTAGTQELSPQDLALLQKAFAAANVELAAHQVANAIGSIEAHQNSGADTGTLAWSRGESASDGSLNLRTFVNDTAPGSNYQPNIQDPSTSPQIPNLLGGMDLSGLASAKPNFFHPDGSVVTEEPEEEGPQTLEEVSILNGQCSCGEVRFTVENAFEYAFFCHCSRCRLRTGSVFAAIAGIDIDKVEVTTGLDHLLIEGECADGYGARCRKCYSFLFAAVRERKYMHVSLGMLTDMPGRVPDHHIYVGSKAPWYQITDSLPQYEELPEKVETGRAED
jgi:hypothetical protein